MFNVKYIRGITSNFERYTQAVFLYNKQNIDF